MADATTQAVATVDMSMLDAAEQNAGFSDPFDDIHTIKVYNPKIGDPIDEAKAFSFTVKEAVTGTVNQWRDIVTFNPIKVSYVWSGSIYPIDEKGVTAKEKVFFTTSEFGKFTKKTDVIGLSTGGKCIASFTKGDFEAFIKTPLIGMKTNQFYERKKDKDGRPYDSTYLSKQAIIYGVIVGGDRDGEHFRFVTNAANLGSTFKDGQVVPAEQGTFEGALEDALPSMNEVLAANGRKPIKSCPPEQTVLQLGVRANERGTFLPEFRFAGILAAMGRNNFDSIEFFQSLLGEKFGDRFANMVPTPIAITDGNAILERPLVIEAPKKSEDQEALPVDAEFAENDPFAAKPAEPVPNATASPLKPSDLPF